MLKLQIQSFKNEEVTLSIGQLMLNQETIINDLCDSMEKINKKFGDYYKKYEKMKSITQLLDDKIEEMIKEKNALNDEWEKKYSEKEKELEKIKEENKQLHAKIKKLTPKDKKPAKKNETKKEEKKIVQQEICTEVKV
jgi:predicted nuclease with TOPRIM domain